MIGAKLTQQQLKKIAEMERFIRRAKAWASKKDAKPLKGGGTDGNL